MAVRRRCEVSTRVRLVARPQEMESALRILQAGQIRALRRMLDEAPDGLRRGPGSTEINDHLDAEERGSGA